MKDLVQTISYLVNAPGLTYPANTYNFCGARIPLVHTQLNIPKWRELFATYPKADIIEKLEFGFPVGVDTEPDLLPAVKTTVRATCSFPGLINSASKKSLNVV